MSLRTALELGRVSNLPTVWSNVLAGIVLAGARPGLGSVVMLGLAASFLYIGGMYLNDAFDAAIDAQERPERPIPSGRVSRGTVLASGFGLLGAGLGLVYFNGLSAPAGPWVPLGAATGTGLLIVLYDLWHKDNPLGPLVMGACRVGVYLIAALSVAPTAPISVLVGGVLLLGYVLGLTHVARHENRSTLGRTWPLVGLLAPLVFSLRLLLGPMWAGWLVVAFLVVLRRARERIALRRPEAIREAVGSLIAGISLVDAMLVARFGAVLPTLACVGAFALTVVLQRKIAGT